MDYGAGSGVLGLAACAFDKSLSAVGVDIDVDAVRIANQNSAVNGLKMVSYLPPLVDTMDSESKSVLMKAYQKEEGQVLPPSLNGPVHEACVANILAGPLVTLAPTLASLVKPGGALGLSGILTPQANMVVEAYDEYFDQVIVEKEIGGWVLITGIRKRN
jgi:ribosomal protein L11 methyltransferase